MRNFLFQEIKDKLHICLIHVQASWINVQPFEKHQHIKSTRKKLEGKLSSAQEDPQSISSMQHIISFTQ